MIQKLLCAFFALIAIGLVAYPLWGILAPDSYAVAELKHHYALHDTTSNAQVVAASFWLYLSNSLLIAALAMIVWYLLHPNHFRWALIAGIAIMVFPLLRVVSRTLMDLELTSHLTSPVVAVSFSTEEFLVSLIGIMLIGVAYVHRTPT